MKTKKFKLRYIFIIWIIVYLLISVFKYFQINSLISKKYGALSKTFNTKMYTNESVVIDGLLLIIGVPITFVTGGAEFTQWLYGDIKLDFKRKLITKIELKSDIMDKTFNITMQGGRIVNDNFYEVISNDQKFTHLYSEWVKKQVGIEDSNVELKFTEAVKGARQIGEKPYIDFNKITNLDRLEDQICECTSGLYVKNVDIYNFPSNDIKDILSEVKRYELLIKPYIFKEGDNILWFGVNIKEQANDKNDPYSYSIVFDYNTNEKKYFIYYENRPIMKNKSEYVFFD